MLMLIWKNISRRRVQSVLTITITLLTVMVFVMVMGVLQTMSTGLEISRERLGADAIIVPRDASATGSDLLFTAIPENIYMSKEVYEQAKELDGVAALSPQFYIQSFEADCCGTGTTIRVVGYDAETDFVLPAFLKEGDDNIITDEEIIMGGGQGEMFLGLRYLLLENQYIVDSVLMPAGNGIDDMVFMNIDVARQLCLDHFLLNKEWKDRDPYEHISVVMVKLEEGVNPHDFEEQFNNSDIKAKLILTGDTISSLQRQLKTTMKVLVGMWFATMVIAVLALVGRFNSLAKERKKEIGLLRAIGVQKLQVFGLIIGEACTMALIGGIIGSGLALLCMDPLIEMLKADFTLSPTVWNTRLAMICAGSGVALALVLGFFAALTPAARSASLDPQTAITQGEVN